MIFYKNLKLKNVQMLGDNLFSATKAMIRYYSYAQGKQPGNIGTPRNKNDWITMNVVKMIFNWSLSNKNRKQLHMVQPNI